MNDDNPTKEQNLQHLRECAEGLRHNAAIFASLKMSSRERQLLATASAICECADEVESLRARHTLDQALIAQLKSECDEACAHLRGLLSGDEIEQQPQAEPVCSDNPYIVTEYQRGFDDGFKRAVDGIRTQPPVEAKRDEITNLIKNWQKRTVDCWSAFSIIEIYGSEIVAALAAPAPSAAASFREPPHCPSCSCGERILGAHSESSHCPERDECLSLKGAPIGMYHCTHCGEMILAGEDPTNYCPRASGASECLHDPTKEGAQHD